MCSADDDVTERDDADASEVELDDATVPVAGELVDAVAVAVLLSLPPPEHAEATAAIKRYAAQRARSMSLRIIVVMNLIHLCKNFN